jgi:hypothetical protein
MEQARTKDLLDRGVNEVLKPSLQALLIFLDSLLLARNI